MAAPDEPRALDALKTVQAIPAKALDELITSEIGNPMLGVFRSLAKALTQGESDEKVAKCVHLMVLAYLLRREVEPLPSRGRQG